MLKDSIKVSQMLKRMGHKRRKNTKLILKQKYWPKDRVFTARKQNENSYADKARGRTPQVLVIKNQFVTPITINNKTFYKDNSQEKQPAGNTSFSSVKSRKSMGTDDLSGIKVIQEVKPKIPKESALNMIKNIKFKVQKEGTIYNKLFNKNYADEEKNDSMKRINTIKDSSYGKKLAKEQLEFKDWKRKQSIMENRK